MTDGADIILILGELKVYDRHHWQVLTIPTLRTLSITY